MRQRRRLFVQNGSQRFGRRRLAEGAFGGEHLVQDHAKSKNIAAGISSLTAYLLRRHVTDGPANFAGLTVSSYRGGSGGSAVGLGLPELGQPEIKDLEASVFREEQVFRLEVPMHDSSVVRRRQPARDFHAGIASLARPHRTATEAIPQGLSLEQFRDDVGTPIVLPDVVNRNNIGVVESGRGLRLQLEAMETSSIARPLVRQNFDGHVAFERSVARTIDFAHAARSQGRDDLIAMQPRAREQPHRCAHVTTDHIGGMTRDRHTGQDQGRLRRCWRRPRGRRWTAQPHRQERCLSD